LDSNKNYSFNQQSDIDDLLFEHRNKNYGAFVLRRRYSKNMSSGILISIMIFLLVLLLPAVNWDRNTTVYEMHEIFLESPPEMKLPASGSTAAASNKKEATKEKEIKKNVTPSEQKKVVKDEDLKPEPSKNNQPADSIKNEPTVDSSNAKKSSGTSGDADLPFDVAEVMPQFPGGQTSLSRLISSLLVYPPLALQNKIQGTVIVGFIIDKNGRVVNPKILKSLYPACDEEALRVVRLMPNWVPAKSQGRAVSINFRIPIEFRFVR
jgi:protein TonB